VLLAIVGVVDGDHVFSLWLRQRQILVITRRFVNRSEARFPPEKGRFSYPPGKAPARRESVGRANVANRYKRAERSSRYHDVQVELELLAVKILDRWA